MGLDVYVGPLCRYYAGDWESVVQRYSREQGISFRVIRAEPEPPDAIRDPHETLPLVEAWRDGLALSLKHEGVDLHWDERPTGDYFTNKPAWDCYGDLLLWAAYLEHPELPRPMESVADYHEDPAYLKAQESTRFKHLLSNAEWWLPADFDFVFETPDPTGSTALFGSSFGLMRELAEINTRSWDRPASELHGASLEQGARFCCAMLIELTDHAVNQRLPMKLDY